MKFLKFLNKRNYKPAQVDSPRAYFRHSGGTTVTTDSSMEVSSFHSGLTYIATQVAKLPWDIKDKNNNVLDGKLSKMIKLMPNPEMNSMSFRLLCLYTAIQKGNFYAEIERTPGGKPTALWPLPTEHVTPTRLEGKLYYRVIGGAVDGSGRDAYLLPEDIYHIPNFHTYDGIVGQGLIAYAYQTLGISLGADRMANNLFKNGGLPSGVLELEGSLTDDAKIRLKEAWDTAHGGRKTGGTAVLEEGLKFKPISLDPSVMQFLESRKFSVLEVARFLRVPPQKLYDSDSSTYNNIEHSNLDAIDTLDAWCRRLEIEIDVKILNMQEGGMKSELNLYEVYRGDMKTRGDYYKSRMSTGSISPNEIRRLEGVNPYEGGDRYFIATNNYTPADRMDELLDSQMKSESVPDDSGEKKEDEKELDNALVKYFDRASR